jgi:hypothetical protein
MIVMSRGMFPRRLSVAQPPNWQFVILSSILGDAVMVHGHCLRPVIQGYVRVRYRL